MSTRAERLQEAIDRCSCSHCGAARGQKCTYTTSTFRRAYVDGRWTRVPKQVEGEPTKIPHAIRTNRLVSLRQADARKATIARITSIKAPDLTEHQKAARAIRNEERREQEQLSEWLHEYGQELFS